MHNFHTFCKGRFSEPYCTVLCEDDFLFTNFRECMMLHSEASEALAELMNNTAAELEVSLLDEVTETFQLLRGEAPSGPQVLAEQFCYFVVET